MGVRYGVAPKDNSFIVRWESINTAQSKPKVDEHLQIDMKWMLT